ncbi:TetR/AcrR family transcriptional regulator [Nakamurella endophytica]|uniref:TetR family transcriptional regulator n=1 Tax=Nakamurella endophytica TaxID=1748367 RepID=A0A917WE22_9ACTN|nr:TetR/AcrR family transcriptional regulator C-terminal domain-containing protein [Nakamurella endophytica]GGL94106.1 TetR family transcriptional regulator [Nakamurella endophytica]
MGVNRGTGDPAGAGRRPGRPAVLSRERVLDAALAIVDRDGLAGLTMRRLGAELHVDPMAVYRHVGDKSGLYDGLVERAFAGVELPARTGHWAEDFAAVVRALRAALLRHPDVAALVGTRPPATPAAFAVVEAAVRVLLDGGSSAEDAADAVDCAGRMVVGHVLADGARSPVAGLDGGEKAHESAQQELNPAVFPGLAAVAHAGVEHEADRLFELALAGLLREVQDRRSRTAGTGPSGTTEAAGSAARRGAAPGRLSRARPAEPRPAG